MLPTQWRRVNNCLSGGASKSARVPGYARGIPGLAQKLTPLAGQLAVPPTMSLDLREGFRAHGSESLNSSAHDARSTPNDMNGSIPRFMSPQDPMLKISGSKMRELLVASAEYRVWYQVWDIGLFDLVPPASHVSRSRR